jgi:hypothetical protein
VISTSNHFSTCELFVLSKCVTFCLLCKHWWRQR